MYYFVCFMLLKYMVFCLIFFLIANLEKCNITSNKVQQYEEMPPLTIWRNVKFNKILLINLNVWKLNKQLSNQSFKTNIDFFPIYQNWSDSVPGIICCNFFVIIKIYLCVCSVVVYRSKTWLITNNIKLTIHSQFTVVGYC